MKSFTSLLACAVASFMMTISACATPPATPGGVSWEVPHFSFEPMSAETQAELRRAFAHCARVEMGIEWLNTERLLRSCSDKRWQLVRRIECDGGDIWTRMEWVRTLTKGAELDAILNKLSAVSQWYTPVFDMNVLYHPCASYSIRLLDAEGNVLFSEMKSIGPWFSCKGEHGERVPFPAFFPDFPDLSSFAQ